MRWQSASIPMSGGSNARCCGVCRSGSLAAGSIAGWRGGAVAARALVLLGRRLAAALGARHGALLARRDTQALDAPWVGVEHLDLESAGPRNHFAADRQPADMRHQIAAERFDVLAGVAADKILPDH